MSQKRQSATLITQRLATKTRRNTDLISCPQNLQSLNSLLQFLTVPCSYVMIVAVTVAIRMTKVRRTMFSAKANTTMFASLTFAKRISIKANIAKQNIVEKINLLLTQSYLSLRSSGFQSSYSINYIIVNLEIIHTVNKWNKPLIATNTRIAGTLLNNRYK